MSTIAHLEGKGGGHFDREAKRADCELGKVWFHRLRKSLRMTYGTSHGGAPISMERVIARVEFDPDVVRAMDACLGKRWGNNIYNLAFDASKTRASRMMKHFDDVQIATNRPFFRHALERFATFAPAEAVAMLSTPLKKSAYTSW